MSAVQEMELVKFNVTEDDIAKGVPGKSEQCAIACAIRRSVEGKGMQFERVSPLFISFIVNDEYVEAETPMRVMRFIYEFDSRRRVSPFDFGLMLPKRVAASPGSPAATSE